MEGAGDLLITSWLDACYFLRIALALPSAFCQCHRTPHERFLPLRPALGLRHGLSQAREASGRDLSSCPGFVYIDIPINLFEDFQAHP